VLRPAYAALGSQVPQQLLFQHSARLNEQASVNGFVDTRMLSSSGYWIFQPSGNLLRRPVQNQFTRNDVPQLHVDGKKAALGPQGRLPGFAVRLTGSIRRTATMPFGPPGSRSIPFGLKHLAISRIDEPEASPREISSRSRSVSARSARRRTAGTIPPVTRHQGNEWTNAPCQKRARSHAMSALPSKRRHTSLFCAAESPNLLPGFINTTFENSFIPDGVASTV